MNGPFERFLHTINVRFFGELHDFLKQYGRGRRLAYTIKGCPSVKDTIEAIGVPHTAVDAIRVNGRHCDFGYQLEIEDTNAKNKRFYTSFYGFGTKVL